MPARNAYEWRPPLAWRLLAVFGYLSWAFGLGVMAPFSIYFLFRNRYLATHAVNAGVLHAVGLLLLGVLYALNFTVVLETEQQILSVAQFLGALFSGDLEVAVVFLVTESMVVLVWITRTTRQREVRQRRRSFPDPGGILIKGLLAILLVIITFYNNVFWPGAGPSGTPIAFERFRDPFLLFPGHLILCACMFFALIALEGKRHRFALARRVYGRFLADTRAARARASGTSAVKERARRAALLRGRLLPGWGQVYLGRTVSGVATFCLFLCVLLFLTISLLLHYGRWVAEVPGLNANAAWYFLAEMGLRSHIPDKAFAALLGNPAATLVLLLAGAGLWWYSIWSTLRLLRTSEPGELRIAGPHSVLAHVVPFVVLLLIPVSFQLPSKQQPPSEPMLVIPEYFESPQRRMQLDGAATSGDESATYGRSGRPDGRNAKTGRTDTPQYRGPGARADSARGKEDRRLLMDERRGTDPKGGRPGKRQDMTYSNYLSAKIRGAEKGFNYWNRLPRPYSGVFEYKISERGELYDIRVVEPSTDPEGDRLTVELIGAMGILLPPPGGGHVLVQELFWNTTPGDPGLPTPLQRGLSHAFDGRVIQQF